MSPETVFALYAVIVLIDLGWSLFLAALNHRHVRKHEREVPEAFRATVSLEEHRKASAYSLAKSRLGFVSGPVVALLSLAAVGLGLLGLADRAAWAAAWGLLGAGAGGAGLEFLRAAIFLGLVLLSSAILDEPFSLYATFVLEKHFGFNTTTLRTYLLDLAKGCLVGCAIGLPLLWLLLAFMRAAGELWWLWAAGGFSALSLVLSVLYPMVIAPLFNKFSPLPEGSLRKRIEELAARCGFRARGILVMDGSKRSRHSNAYFTGLGRSRRIVLYDTLVSSMSEDEVLAVLAHEIGHWKRRHVPKMAAVSVASSFLAFWAIAALMEWPALYAGFGFVDLTGLAGPAGSPLMTREAILAVFALVSGPATFFLTPLFSSWSRRHEYEADRYAAAAVGPEAMVSALVRLNRENASNLCPHPLYSAWYYSHPAPAERVAALGAGAARDAAAASGAEGGRG